MKIVSWNVNGIRAVVKKGFADFIKKYQPDVLCLQEIKISDDARAKVEFDFPGYEEYWHSAQRPGYSGTAILVKSEKSLRLSSGQVKVKSYLTGFQNKAHDNEGRVQALELEKFYLVNIYFPNANHELSRLDFKLNFNEDILELVEKLEKKKPVLVCGDFNVAHQEIDLARPKDNVGSPGFTKEERSWMDEFIRSGFTDTFRHINKNKIQYSWWSYRFNARARNIGWRIDYFCASKRLLPHIKDAFILDKIPGSDHAPVGVDLEF